MKNTLFALLAVVSALVAVFFFYRFQTTADGSMNLILGILFVVVFVGLGIMYMTNKVNKQEDIHITE